MFIAVMNGEQVNEKLRIALDKLLLNFVSFTKEFLIFPFEN